MRAKKAQRDCIFKFQHKVVPGTEYEPYKVTNNSLLASSRLRFDQKLSKSCSQQHSLRMLLRYKFDQVCVCSGPIL